MNHPLDNPAWVALTSLQREFGLQGSHCARYLPTISPIAALADESDASFAGLAALVAPGEVVAVTTRRAFPQAEWLSMADLELGLWVMDEVAAPASEAGMVVLGAADAADMLSLARAADPGPFEIDTYRLGTYLGIRIDGELVAMAGERMRLPGFVEVSAVATRPGFEGRGYASRLVAAVVARQVGRSERPFLHVRTGSPAERAAVRVYEKLGFRLRSRPIMRVARRRGGQN